MAAEVASKQAKLTTRTRQSTETKGDMQGVFLGSAPFMGLSPRRQPVEQHDSTPCEGRDEPRQETRCKSMTHRAAPKEHHRRGGRDRSHHLAGGHGAPRDETACSGWACARRYCEDCAGSGDERRGWRPVADLPNPPQLGPQADPHPQTVQRWKTLMMTRKMRPKRMVRSAQTPSRVSLDSTRHAVRPEEARQDG